LLTDKRTNRQKPAKT